MWEIFIEQELYFTYIFEIIAALSGLFYLFKSRSPGTDVKLLVYLLVFVFVYDISSITWGLYGYVYDFKYLEFVKGTSFTSHYWVVNTGIMISVALYAVYFALQLASLKRRRFIYILIGLYVLSSMVSFGIGDAFFKTTSSFVYMVGIFLISLSIGLLLSQLCATPIYIFHKFIAENPEFREVYNYVLDGSNFFMYALFSVGFIIKYLELRKKVIEPEKP